MLVPAITVLAKCLGIKRIKRQKQRKMKSPATTRNPGHLTGAASALSLSYDIQRTTTSHNPLYVLHK